MTGEIATFENTKPGDVLVSTGWEVEVLFVNERGFLIAADRWSSAAWIREDDNAGD